MPKHADCNQIGTGTVSTQRLKELLKLAGWLIIANGDAVGGYSTTADLAITSTFWNNAGAWQVWREPGGRREWCWQRGSTGNNARIKYSASARFIGGTPTSWRVPAAADEIVILGSGSDATPGYASLWSTDNSYRLHAVAWSTPINGVYPFIAYCTQTPSGLAAGGLIMQEPLAAGTYDPSEEDPCVVHASTNAAPVTAVGWLGYNTAGQLAVGFTGNIPTPDFALEFRTLKEPMLRVQYTATSGGKRNKGCGDRVFGKGLNKYYPNTINRTSDALLYLPSGGYNTLMPFADNTEPLM